MTDADADAPVDAVDPGDRDRILDLLEDGIQEAHRKVESGRACPGRPGRRRRSS